MPSLAGKVTSPPLLFILSSDVSSMTGRACQKLLQNCLRPWVCLPTSDESEIFVPVSFVKARIRCSFSIEAQAPDSLSKSQVAHSKGEWIDRLLTGPAISLSLPYSSFSSNDTPSVQQASSLSPLWPAGAVPAPPRNGSEGC